MSTTRFDEEKNENELNFILRSDIKLNILKELYKQDSTIKELEESGLNYGSLLSSLKQLNKEGYVVKNDNEYKLSNSMRMKLSNLLYLNEIIEETSSVKEYLNTHLLRNDIIETLSEIPITDDLQIINNTPLNPYKVVNNFSKNMVENGQVKCIFTYLHPEFEIIFNDHAKFKSELNILVAEDIKKYLVYDKQKSVDKSPLVNRQINIKSINPIKLSLVVSEKEVMIVLYNKNGTYDTNSALISNDLKMIKFGNRIFDEIESYSSDEYTNLNLL
ncbi:MAG: transcriptional regulator FilR1 domain-containing protein [Methanosphaera sp.]